MTLILHRGAELVPYENLSAITPPEATASHVPVAHHEIVELMRYTLGFYNHEIVEEAHALTPDGMDYFGLLTLRSTYGDYSDACAIRNSHVKHFPVGIAFGAKVMICDNLSLLGEHVIRRKHTPRAKRELPGLLAEIVEPLKERRVEQQRKFDTYKRTMLTDQAADHFIMQLYREGVIGVQKIADVAREWDTPSFDDFKADRSAWRAFNAATYALTGRVAEHPKATADLHKILDLTCEHIS